MGMRARLPRKSETLFIIVQTSTPPRTLDTRSPCSIRLLALGARSDEASLSRSGGIYSDRSRSVNSENRVGRAAHTLPCRR